MYHRCFGALNRQLQPVTQLYVSVDAATRDGLKAIDRPLFKDFWQRFLDCLTELRDKRQRTVYRCSPMPIPNIVGSSIKITELLILRNLSVLLTLLLVSLGMCPLMQMHAPHTQLVAKEGPMVLLCHTPCLILFQHLPLFGSLGALH